MLVPAAGLFGYPIPEAKFYGLGRDVDLFLTTKSSASYTNSLFYVVGSDLPGERIDVGRTNQGADLGVGEDDIVALLPVNEEITFGIEPAETGNVFYTGPGNRNPDGQIHAIVELMEGQGEIFYRVQFEDLLNLGDSDFNDFVFDVYGVTHQLSNDEFGETTDAVNSPEPASLAAWIAMGLLLAVVCRWRWLRDRTWRLAACRSKLPTSRRSE